MSIALRDWDAGLFESRVGEIFTVQSAGTTEAITVQMELLAVTRHTPPPGAAAGVRAEPFDLLYRTVDRKALPQGLSRLVHEEFQPEELYLVRIMPPSGMATDQVYYEAIFT